MKRTGEGCARPVKSGRLPLPLLIQPRLAAGGLLLALLLGGCTPAASPVESGAQPATAPPTATAAATPTPDPGYEPVFEPGACRFAHRVEWGAQCGDLIVPENRADPGGRTIRLHVAVFKSTREHPAPDPVIHLVGGPGASLLDEAERYLRAGGRHILAERDYILFNQRGSAYGQPELGCGEYEQFLWRIAEERPDQDEAERIVDATEKHMGPADVVQPAPAPVKFYDPAKFDHNLPKWAETIQQGRKSAQDYIDFAVTRGEPFTEEQKARLLSIKATPPADEVQDVQPKSDAAPAVTYASLAGRLQNAANLDELDEVATMIGAVENPQHRQKLAAIYEDAQASFG